MALGRQGAVQDALLIGWHEVPSAPGHVFYDRLNGLLDEAGFDRAVEALCQPHYASGGGRPSIPPGRYFRMLLVGYFEGLDSERGIAWCCADSLSLQRFLKLGPGEAVPDRSTLAQTRARLPLEVHGRRVRAGPRPAGRARADQGPPGRHRRLDHGGERGDALDRAARTVPAQAGDAGRARPDQRDRDPDHRSAPPVRSGPQGASWSRTAAGSARPTPRRGSRGSRTAAPGWPTSRSTRSIWTAGRSSRPRSIPAMPATAGPSRLRSRWQRQTLLRSTSRRRATLRGRRGQRLPHPGGAEAPRGRPMDDPHRRTGALSMGC